MDKYEECKGRLRSLLQKMEESSAEEGMATLDTFVKHYEASLYNEIGKLTRLLHDSLITFQCDEKIHNLTRKDIPSTKERLKYVVELTEQAAHKVLGIIEKCIPISLEISKGASDLDYKLSEKTGITEPSGMLGKTKVFLAMTKENASTLRGYLTEVLMAQEYQDITGQIIKKVIDLVQEMEDNLVRLIKLTGHANTHREEQKDSMKVDGPCVPGVNDRLVYTAGQDDVDQLLASLGF